MFCISRLARAPETVSIDASRRARAFEMDFSTTARPAAEFDRQHLWYWNLVWWRIFSRQVPHRVSCSISSRVGKLVGSRLGHFRSRAHAGMASARVGVGAPSTASRDDFLSGVSDVLTRECWVRRARLRGCRASSSRPPERSTEPVDSVAPSADDRPLTFARLGVSARPAPFHALFRAAVWRCTSPSSPPARTAPLSGARGAWPSTTRPLSVDTPASVGARSSASSLAGPVARSSSSSRASLSPSDGPSSRTPPPSRAATDASSAPSPSRSPSPSSSTSFGITSTPPRAPRVPPRLSPSHAAHDRPASDRPTRFPPVGIERPTPRFPGARSKGADCASRAGERNRRARITAARAARASRRWTTTVPSSETASARITSDTLSSSRATSRSETRGVCAPRGRARGRPRGGRRWRSFGVA